MDLLTAMYTGTWILFVVLLVLVASSGYEDYQDYKMHTEVHTYEENSKEDESLSIR